MSLRGFSRGTMYFFIAKVLQNAFMASLDEVDLRCERLIVMFVKEHKGLWKPKEEKDG